MWNVNKTDTSQGVVNAECFILTMWNVNKGIYVLVDLRQQSFILTMWNVNHKEVDSKGNREKVLY